MFNYCGGMALREPVDHTAEPALHVPLHPVRVVTATSLFDGHDAAINVMRRLLQAQGCEVIHLGHDRSVDDIVAAAVEEDVQAVAVSSYQGGHLEFFGYLLDRLREVGAGHVDVFGGGGGVIVDDDVAALHAAGVTRIFTPLDGARLGLARMVNTIVAAADRDPLGAPGPVLDPDALRGGDRRALARTLTALELGRGPAGLAEALRERRAATEVPVLGITGTGGAGKSSLTDELLGCFARQPDPPRVVVLAVDPSRRRGGGALLGDRIRMGSLDGDRIFLRSLASRSGPGGLPAHLDDLVAAAVTWGAELVVVETPGMGQGDAAIVDHVDVACYVMTPEFGAATQLEKIEMLDAAHVVVVNKVDRHGGPDAVRAVGRQLARSGRSCPDGSPVEVFATVASRFADEGTIALHAHLRRLLGLDRAPGPVPREALPYQRSSPERAPVVSAARSGYLAEVARAVRAYRARTAEQAAAVRDVQRLRDAAAILADAAVVSDGARSGEALEPALSAAAGAAAERVDPESVALLEAWPERAERARAIEPWVSPSGTPVPVLALPELHDDGDLLRWLREENLPGSFPFTAGTFARRAVGEAPARMFAGEGGPARTNRRLHLLAKGQSATRLSVAFDSVTLYGRDPAVRPDVYGKIGNAGVSVATLDDMKLLFEGFDLCDPSTSVSMTINGPAPTILAMFMATAYDQRLDRFAAEHGRPATPDEAEACAGEVRATLRGTVQADILKEDQGQNTCIFSTEFALRMMADVVEWFVANDVRRFYSASVSGYHIAEAGANPITQLAFTLANAFTYVEAYLARGLEVDDFAPGLSFFFSAGMDPEYSVLGRVARRVWAIALRDVYGADERSQRLKYHIQTSGRSLHAQEMAFNDIRTTLQALGALDDACNSLHTNAYDEAVTTPSEASVRRALAIQLIIGQEWGRSRNENPNQGSFALGALTDLVEQAVLDELDRLSERGGVLGAMETGYQRGRIQDESMRYEQAKHDGSLPIVGVNTFVGPPTAAQEPTPLELARSTDAEKRDQLDRLARFRAAHDAERPAILDRLARVALDGGNVFEVLIDAVRVATLGEITETLFAVGGRYRRNV